ncbi:MAG TPA: hypothetical protein VGE26_00495, partial [Sphingobacteriaceae bacterium]
SAFLAGQDVKAREKRYEPRIPYNEKKPLIVSGNGGDGRNLLYHSMLTGYTPGLGLGYSITTDSISGKKITGRNLSMAWLYKIAYSEGKRYFNDHNVVFDTKRKYDLTSAKHGEAYRDWLIDNHGFCYELLVPLALKSDAYKVMQQDLRRFFTSYDAELEKRKKECLILVRTSKTDKIASGGGTVKHQMDRFGWDLQNASLDNLIFRLNFNQVTSMPLLNETGYKGRVDLSIKAAFPDLEAVNRELKRYDLQFIKADREIEVLVISDRDPATSHQAVQ